MAQRSAATREIRQAIREVLADSLRVEVKVQFDENDNQVITVGVYIEDELLCEDSDTITVGGQE